MRLVLILGKYMACELQFSELSVMCTRHKSVARRDIQVFCMACKSGGGQLRALADICCAYLTQRHVVQADPPAAMGFLVFSKLDRLVSCIGEA